MSDTRFWAKVIVSDNCWEWAGARDRHGYGVLTRQRRLRLAHRYSYEMACGAPGEAYVLHRCDNRVCVRPEHLFLGTHEDNMADMIAKRRSLHRHGEKAPHRRLTEVAVQEIVRRCLAGEKRRCLAAEYGVAYVTISKLMQGKIWKSVTHINDE